MKRRVYLKNDDFKVPKDDTPILNAARELPTRDLINAMAALEREHALLQATLRIVLAHWPRQDILDSLEPDSADISRPALLDTTPRTREVRQWRLIARGESSGGGGK